MERLRKNNEYEATITSYTSEGYGVAKIDGMAVFVPYAIVGEVHRIRILKVNNHVCYGKSVQLLCASPEREQPPCAYYYKCGGCHLMHMSYEEELRFKLNKVNEILHRIGKQNFDITEIIASDHIYRYRNKAVFDVSENQFGFYKARTHDLVPIDDCLLQSEDALNIAKQIDLEGLNHIYIRNQVCTVLGPEYHGIVPQGLNGLLLCDNRRENSIVDGTYRTLWGDDSQTIHLCGYDFIISPQSFFQINKYQTEKLYKVAYDFAVPGKEALELYCGVGTIGIILSSKFEHINSCEIIPEAIENAKRNAKINHITNIDFMCADAKDLIMGEPNTVILDPPRKGLDSNVISSLLSVLPEYILYISCDPATLARDILKLSECYTISKAVAVDMFPRTYHVETVVLLCKK